MHCSYAAERLMDVFVATFGLLFILFTKDDITPQKIGAI